MKRIFDHVDLRVPDLRRAGSFYRTLLPALGFTVEVAIPGWLQFEAPGSGPTQFFGIIEDRAHRPNSNRIAFWAETEKRVDELARIAADAGATAIEGPAYESEDYYAVYFEDPAGNRLEICHRKKSFKERQLAI
jgi:catechol 2,3-dioxygenase-like lactoylglutathione lyase family enzyme